MDQNKKRKKRSSGSGRIHRGGLLAFFLVIAFMVDILQTGLITVVKGDEYRAKAEEYQLSDTSISAMRGTIYDCNMNILAQSASVWRVYINPSKVKGTDEEKQKIRQDIAENLSVILGVSVEGILKKFAQTETGYQRIAGQVERPQMEQVEAFRREVEKKSDDKIGYITIIGIESDAKRYYPNSNLASALIGFTGDGDNGLSGLESAYNDLLTGIDGRIVTAKDGKMNQLPSEYEVVYDAEQGANLVLTIDETVQYSLENALRQTMEDTNATYSYGIVMEVDTGAVLGMVSLPDYDLNNPNEITEDQIDRAFAAQEKSNAAASKEEQEKYAAMTDEEKRNLAAMSARYAVWRNRSISDTYEPGSVGKCITVAAGLEEGVVDETFTYDCTGSILVADTIYNCWKDGGHGHEEFADLLKNSCNPFAITVAKLLGAEKYYEYFEAFGFTERTGIDLPGEATPVAGTTYHNYADFGITQLASCSFGQTFQISPIQMITAIAAIANGGKLMTPYVVAKQLDAEGNVTKVTEPTVRRQVISESTAKTMCSLMEQVVSTGTGKNANVAGYHVAGKTGTSEKLQNKGQYVASFVGFAPADDPQIAILIAIDEPQGDHGGGAIAAPVASQVLETILPYLNIEASYSDDELENLVTQCPGVVGSDIDAAKQELWNAGYSVKVRGDGETVCSQIPEAGNQIPKNGVVILYTEDDYGVDTVTVPDFSGYSVSEVNDLATSSGLNVKISGNASSGSSIVAYKQSVESGQQVSAGTVITVYFRTMVGVNDGTD